MTERTLPHDMEPLAGKGPAFGERPPVVPADVMTLEDESKYGLSMWRLMWRKFKRNRFAMAGGVVVILFYLGAIFAPFVAPYSLEMRFTNRVYAPPMTLHLTSEGLVVYDYDYVLNMETFQREFTPNEERPIRVRFFVRGEPYSILGVINSDIHLFGSDDPNTPVLLLGSDRQGRDMVTRIFMGSQISLSIGLVGVTLSLLIGTVFGVASGYYGGIIDELMQRVIEIIRAFPAVPLWMALSAAVPRTWPALQTYFIITVILSVIGWTWLARQLRGRVLSLRQADFVVASKLAGASDGWIIFRHLIPATLSQIIVVTTLAIPTMILAETALSFLGIGIRPPLTSWGVLLNEIKNVATLSHYRWLFTPVLFVSGAVLAFNFLGDGIRDAADPYSM